MFLLPYIQTGESGPANRNMRQLISPVELKEPIFCSSRPVCLGIASSQRAFLPGLCKRSADVGEDTSDRSGYAADACNCSQGDQAKEQSVLNQILAFFA